MKPGRLEAIYKNDEERRVANILLKIVIALLLGYVVVAGMELYWGDRTSITITFIGSAVLLAPLGLLLRGHLRASGLIVVISVLATVTIIATDGQGIHDIAIMSFPVIIVLSGLIMERRDFYWLSFINMCMVAWLVFGEEYGLFSAKPYETPQLPDFIVVGVILVVTIFAVDMLAENIRRNINQAHQEISSRKTIESELRFQNTHDQLTGVYNRAYFEEVLRRMEQGEEYPVSIIVTDVDYLKQVNDTEGHATGDELLRNTAEMLNSVFRAGDVLARIGGDEFAILLARTDSPTVKQISLRIHSALDQHNAIHAGLPIQLSIGCATAEWGKLMETFILADEQMYADKAKRRKNQMLFARP